jgi:O-antigen/teichoic acid export membrane protein
MNLAQKIAKESTITFFGMVYGNIIRYVYTALLARWVGIEYLGIYALANSITLISEVLGKMGIESGVMRFVSRLNIDTDSIRIQKIIVSALKMTASFSLIIMISLIFSARYIVTQILDAPPILTMALMVFAVAIPFNALTSVSAFSTQGFKRLKYKTLVTQFLNPTLLLVSMILCFWFFSKESAIIAPTLITGVIVFFVMIILLKRVSGVTINQIRQARFDTELLKFSYPLMFVIILQTFMHWMDILMLGYFTDAATVGLYHPAIRTAGLLNALIVSFVSIYAPIMSQLHNEGDFSEMSHLYKLVSRWMITFAIPVSLIFIIYPSKMMLLFGPDYMAGSSVLVILTVATFIQAALGAASPALGMSGYTRLTLWNSLGAFILNIVLNVVLIPKYGIIGAAWATLISLVAIGIARIYEVWWILKLSFISSKMIKPLLAGAVTWWCLWSIRPLVMNFHTLVTLLFVSMVSILIFGIGLWIMKFEPEDKDFLAGLDILKKSLKKEGK